MADDSHSTDDHDFNRLLYENYQKYGKLLAKRRSVVSKEDEQPPPAKRQKKDATLIRNDVTDIDNKSSDKVTNEKQVKPSEFSSDKSQLFSGLVFLFIPKRENSNIHRIRIKSFEAAGAKVIGETQCEIATHVLIPRSWSSSQFKDYCSDSNLKLSLNVAVMYDDWPSLCIEGGSRLDELVAFYDEHGKEPGLSSKADDEDSKSTVVESRVAAPPVQASQNVEQDDFSAQVDDARMLRHAEALISDVDGEDDDEDQELTDVETGAPNHVKTARKPKLQEFLCAQDKSKSKISPSNPNAVAITKLSLLMAYYESLNDSFRVLAYRKAIRSLQNCPTHITTFEQAKKLFGVGSSLAKKIEEAANTGTIKKLDYASESEEPATLALLRGIYGVGIKTALKWYRQGIRSLEDVAKMKDLTENQRVGLKHYYDFQDRIPRAEVRQHFDIVKKAVQEIDPNIEVEVMGSYRRGSPDCGDIDIILTKRNMTILQLRRTLNQLLTALTNAGYVQWTFSGLEEKSDRWLGATATPPRGKWRRMDILLVPYEYKAGYFLYYTGNDLFNRSMRLLARKRGYKLNEKGLFLRKPKSSNGDDTGPRIDNNTEQDIFDKLGIKYRPPQERNVG